MSDEAFLRQALELAEAGRGRVEPNPLVGAVVVRDGVVVGRGHHARYGGPHAEVVSLADAGVAARGATVYLTLEPCGHHGKTPPCAEALARAGVARVVFAAADPAPWAAGRGLRILADAGVPAEGGCLAEEARALNRRFEVWLARSTPWVIAKWGASLDGLVADARGGSRYITGEASRTLVHEIRGSVDAIAIGSGTALADDPSLTCRSPDLPSPRRVVLDRRLRTPPDGVLASTAREVRTSIATAPGADPDRRRALEAAGCEVLEGANLEAVLAALRADGVNRLLLEGGPTVHAAALAAGLVDQVMAFSAPVLLGGAAAPGPVGGAGVATVEAPLRLADVRVSQCGADVLVEGFLDR